MKKCRICYAKSPEYTCDSCREWMAKLANFREWCRKRDSCPADRDKVCTAVFVGDSRDAELAARAKQDLEKKERTNGRS